VCILISVVNAYTIPVTAGHLDNWGPRRERYITFRVFGINDLKSKWNENKRWEAGEWKKF
jgi:hypothetical protein